MAHYLVIVESPAKVKTIKKFLGKQLYSSGIKRDMSEICRKVSLESMWSMILNQNILQFGEKGDILANLRKEAKKARQSISGNRPRP